jgi:hypothetical protein
LYSTRRDRHLEKQVILGYSLVVKNGWLIGGVVFIVLIGLVLWIFTWGMNYEENTISEDKQYGFRVRQVMDDSLPPSQKEMQDFVVSIKGHDIATMHGFIPSIRKEANKIIIFIEAKPLKASSYSFQGESSFEGVPIEYRFANSH